MTRDDILNLSHGPEMDSLIAWQIFGIADYDGPQTWSTSLIDSLDVEAEMTRKGLTKRYAAELLELLGWYDRSAYFVYSADLASLFIRILHAPPHLRCKAALLALLKEEV